MPKLKLPPYGSIALAVLPEFLKMIGENHFEIERIATRHDCRIPLNEYEGWVIIRGRFHFPAITFLFRYRPGEEGTRGEVDDLYRIEYNKGADYGKKPWKFSVERHSCGCVHCPVKFFFIPFGVDSYKFERVSAAEQKEVIRGFLAEPPAQ